MNRDHVIVMAAAVFCIVAMGVAAATLTTAVTVEGEPVFEDRTGPIDDSIFSDVDPVSDADDRTGGTGSGESSDVFLTTCIEFLTTLPGMFAVFLGFVASLAFFAWWRGLPFMVLAGAVISGPVLIAYFMLTNCPGGGFMGSGIGDQTSLPGEGGESVIADVPMPAWMIFGFVAAVALVGILGLIFLTGKPEAMPEADEDEASADEMREIARAAGRAADNIEANADVDNAVYEAWKEMTTFLAVDRPKSSTPGEFAAAATEAGMDATDVDELTQLFEEVRYGGREASPEREERALGVFRTIEEGYSASTADMGGTDTDVDTSRDGGEE